MDFSFGPEQQQLLDRVEQLTRERLAPRAAHYDREIRHPVENWQDLWREGFLALQVPRAYGGLEVDPLTYVAAIDLIARGCASTAMTMHMHSVVTQFIATLGTPDQQARYFPEVVERGKLFGSWGSEPQVSLTRTFLVETTIRPKDGGYLVGGTKHFCTMAGAASYYMVWSALEGRPDMSQALLLALIPAENPGVDIFGDWDTLGMHGTVSPAVRLNDCFIREDDVLGPPGAPIRAGVMEIFGLGYAAVYLGTAQGALDYTLDYCRTKTFQPDNVPIANDPMIQRHCAEMVMALDSARLMLYQSAIQWPQADPARRGVLAAQAKYLATEASLMVTSRCLQVCGGRSATRALPIERAFRDVRTSTLMPPNVDTTLTTIGKARLGLGAQAFKFG